eukprot:3981297-Karenia_brevis.AAC.1
MCLPHYYSKCCTSTSAAPATASLRVSSQCLLMPSSGFHLSLQRHMHADDDGDDDDADDDDDEPMMVMTMLMMV